MGIKNHNEGIDEYAIQLIKYKARQLVGRAGFTISDREDLEQEMMLDLLQRLPKYNPHRVKRSTFIARVTEHKIANVIEARKAGMRDYRRCRCSLNDRREDKDGKSTERLECIDQEEYLNRTGRLSRPVVDMHHLALDVRKTVDRLTPDLRYQHHGGGSGKAPRRHRLGNRDRADQVPDQHHGHRAAVR